eukprot:COSAG06_NODE_135_length_22418_cov_9.162104_14_plen_679_part_00
MLSAYPRSNSSYSAVVAYKPISTDTLKPTSEEQVALIRTTMWRLEDARTGGKPAGYAKVHVAIADPAGPGRKVCAWVVAHDSQDRVKSSDSVARKARRESGPLEAAADSFVQSGKLSKGQADLAVASSLTVAGAQRKLNAAVNNQKQLKTKAEKEKKEKAKMEEKEKAKMEEKEKEKKQADEKTAAGRHENTAMEEVDKSGHVLKEASNALAKANDELQGADDANRAKLSSTLANARAAHTAATKATKATFEAAFAAADKELLLLAAWAKEAAEGRDTGLRRRRKTLSLALRAAGIRAASSCSDEAAIAKAAALVGETNKNSTTGWPAKTTYAAKVIRVESAQGLEAKSVQPEPDDAGPVAMVLEAPTDLLALRDDALGEFVSAASKVNKRDHEEGAAAATDASLSSPKRPKYATSATLSGEVGRGGTTTVSAEGRLSAHAMKGDDGEQFKHAFPLQWAVVENVLDLFKGILSMGSRNDHGGSTVRLTGMNPYAELLQTWHSAHNDAMWLQRMQECSGTMCIALADPKWARPWALHFPAVAGEIADMKKPKTLKKDPFITSIPNQQAPVAVLWFGMFFNWYCLHAVPTLGDIAAAVDREPERLKDSLRQASEAWDQSQELQRHHALCFPTKYSDEYSGPRTVTAVAEELAKRRAINSESYRILLVSRNTSDQIVETAL